LGLALARRGFFNGMMQGLAFCHGLGLHHRDIKLENLMLAKGADGELTVKLADFGLSDLRVLPSDLSGTFCGSPLYAAPELMTTGACPDGYDASRSDIWSCGVVLYALLASCLPFDADDIQALVRMIQEGKPSAPVPRARGDDASALVLSMLQVDPNARPSAAEVLTHAWAVLDTSRPAINQATVGTTLPAAGTLELEGQEGGGNSGSNPAESKAGVNAALDDLEPPSPAHRRGASETTAFFKSMRAKEDLRAAKEAATTAAGAEGAEGAAGAGREAGGGAVWDLGAAWAAGAGGEGPRKAGANMTVEEREMIRREREAMKEELT
jgi:serine/threonine protein kinase